MRSIAKTAMILFSLVACLGAILGWAMSSERQKYRVQGPYEQHG